MRRVAFVALALAVVYQFAGPERLSEWMDEVVSFLPWSGSEIDDTACEDLPDQYDLLTDEFAEEITGLGEALGQLRLAPERISDARRFAMHHCEDEGELTTLVRQEALEITGTSARRLCNAVAEPIAEIVRLQSQEDELLERLAECAVDREQ